LRQCLEVFTFFANLHLNAHSHQEKKLGGEALASLRVKWSAFLNLSKSELASSFLFVDELSMLGGKLMYWLSHRLQEIIGNTLAFGGISIVLVGDFAQLPPVMDTPLFMLGFLQLKRQDLVIGKMLFSKFKDVVVLQKNFRVDADSQKFRQFLMRLRDGQFSETDFQHFFQNRTLGTAKLTDSEQEDFQSATRLVATNAAATKHNIQSLIDCNTPVAKLTALQSDSVARSASTNDSGGLVSVLFVAVGSRVMLTSNLWQLAGLFNGSTGVVVDIYYSSSARATLSELPDVIFVQFDEMYIGPTFDSRFPRLVPITIKRSTFWKKSGIRYRIQMPLILANAVTVWKSQGSTLNRATGIIDLGASERPSGYTFTAFSRVRKKRHYLLEAENVTPARFKSISTSTIVAISSSSSRSERFSLVCSFYSVLRKHCSSGLRFLPMKLSIFFPGLQRGVCVLFQI
jgi:hypothetical protein